MTKRMSIATTLALAVAAALVAGAATAERSSPEDQRLDLGSQQGDVYAVPQADGLHVVATFAQSAEAAVPVRFETVLAPGQTVKVSSPRAAGEPAYSVALTRHGDQVEVHKLPAMY